jgi:hypothetical protein
VIRTLALSGAAGLVALLLMAPDGSPPTTEPASQTTGEPADEAPAPGAAEQVELENSPEFERELAELAFALYLGNELDVDSGTYSCTEPPSLSVGESITCFTLVGNERVLVAVTELTDTSGVYEFELISDHQVGAVAPTTPTSSTVSSASTTTLPVPVIITTAAPLTAADTDLLAYGEQINAGSAAFVDNLIGGGEGVVEAADYGWNGATATVTFTATLSPSSNDSPDVAAWIIARDRALDLWDRASPFRAEGTTLRPSLEITVDGMTYQSDFELCVRVADQTIAMTDWLAESRVS